jgi:hypothetical protein
MSDKEKIDMLTVKNSVKFGLLFLSWIAWFYVLTFFTELSLTPWNAALHWPDVGTWQRTLNDFFATDPGRLIISIPVILFNIYLAVSALRRNPKIINRLVLLGWLFIPAFIWVWFTAVMITHWLFPYPPVAYDPNYIGFHLSILPGVAMVATCLIWLRQQSRITKNASGATLLNIHQ